MLKKLIIGIVVLIIVSFQDAYGQYVSKDTLIRFTGVVVEKSNLDPLPQTNIINKNRRKGTTSDEKGIFRFLARINDTIFFSSVGYKTKVFIVPDTLTKYKYSLFQTMSMDTINLPEAVIYPFPTYEKLKEQIAKTKSEEEILNEIAKENLSMVKEEILKPSYSSDASLNFKYFIQNETRKMYYNGGVQPMPIFDIFAWVKFVKAWKSGAFKKKK